MFESCQVLSVIPATFDRDQFTANLDHQLNQSHRFSGKFFFSNQPSRDPLANGNALTNHEREELTRQRTFSFTDLHIFSPTVVNEFRAGFFKNRNDNDPVAYFMNSEFRIENPQAGLVPDLSQITIRGDRDVGGQLRVGNKGLSDFHRTHRLILSWAWDLPFHGNRFVDGWQIAGIGTFQSGRPFTVFDDDFSGVIFGTTDPRPDLAPGATHEDQTTPGPVTDRVDNYLNRSAFVSSFAVR